MPSLYSAKEKLGIFLVESKTLYAKYDRPLTFKKFLS